MPIRSTNNCSGGGGEQLLGIVLQRVGQWQGQDRIDRFAGDAQLLPTGREHMQAPALLHQVLHHAGAGVHEMFAIVEDQQQLLVGQIVLEPFKRRLANLIRQVEDPYQRLRHQFRPRQLGQFHQPDAIGKGTRVAALHHADADLGCQACFAHAAGSRERHQTLGGDALGNVGQVMRCVR